MLMCAIVYLGEIRGQLVKIASPTMWVLREHTQLGRMLAVAQLAEFPCQLSTRSCGDPLGYLDSSHLYISCFVIKRNKNIYEGNTQYNAKI